MATLVSARRITNPLNLIVVGSFAVLLCCALFVTIIFGMNNSPNICVSGLADGEQNGLSRRSSRKLGGDSRCIAFL